MICESAGSGGIHHARLIFPVLAAPALSHVETSMHPEVKTEIEPEAPGSPPTQHVMHVVRSGICHELVAQVQG